MRRAAMLKAQSAKAHEGDGLGGAIGSTLPAADAAVVGDGGDEAGEGELEAGEREGSSASG
jgi:hypothetical protein